MKLIDVHIHTNNQCNLRCVHCYENVADEKKLCLDDDFEMAVIQYLCSNYDADIHLEGGEVFLEEHLIQALARLDTVTRKHITVTSNGTILTTSTETFSVLRSLACLRISVEGHTEEMQYKIRGCSLQRVLCNALYYQNAGVPVVIRLTLNTLNINTMFSKTLPSLIDKGFSRFQIYEMQPVGRGETSGLCITMPLGDFLNDWFKHPLNADIKVSLPGRRIQEVQENLERLREIGIHVYDAGNEPSISIGVSGDVRVCAWDMVSDPITVLAKKTINNVKKFIDCQTEAHKCDYCTRIVLKGTAQC
jgi:sulfatase maturation enzyme AslB (radical SAM superfamily)